jgi:TolA-binding protein
MSGFGHYLWWAFCFKKHAIDVTDKNTMKKFIIFLSLLFIPLVTEASFDINLYYGLQNNNSVKELQEFLTDKGFYSGPITGNFFSLTIKGVKDFQNNENISPVSGFFGPLTRTRANEILSTNIEPSNQQAVQETGSIPPPSESAKTTNDVVKSLQDQIALLIQQIALLQSQASTTQQLQQTVQQQTQTIIQIRQDTQQVAQNTQQIVQNTTLVCSPNWSCESWSSCVNSQQTRICADSNSCGNATGKPSETQVCQNKSSLEIFSPIPGKGLGRTYAAYDWDTFNNNNVSNNERPTGFIFPNESNEIDLGLIVRNETGSAVLKYDVTIDTPDLPNQDCFVCKRFIKGTGTDQTGIGSVAKIYNNGTPEIVSYYPFHYEFKSSGEQIITFSVNGMTKSVTLNVK